MWPIIKALRKEIYSKMPNGTISPEHTADQHFYRYNPRNEVYPSVTTKLEILNEGYLKKWAANKSVDYIRENWMRVSISDAERELVFLEAEKSHVTIFEDAGDIGTKIHNVIENYLNEWIATEVRPANILDMNTETDPRIISALRGAEKFFKERYVLPVFSELLVASPKYKVAGTLDCLAFIGTVLVDGRLDCDHELWEKSSPYKVGCTKCPFKMKYELSLVDFKTSNKITKPKYMMQVAAYWESLKELNCVKAKRSMILGLDKKTGGYVVEPIVDKKRSQAFRTYLNTIKVYDWLKSPMSEFELPIKKILEI